VPWAEAALKPDLRINERPPIITHPAMCLLWKYGSTLARVHASVLSLLETKHNTHTFPRTPPVPETSAPPVERFAADVRQGLRAAALPRPRPVSVTNRVKGTRVARQRMTAATFACNVPFLSATRVLQAG